MDDIDALEIDEDEYSMHSLSSKRNKISTPATLVPEGWPTLHNASGMLGPARSTQSPMTDNTGTPRSQRVQHPSLPGPAGDLKMTDGESSLAQPKAMRSLPLPPELLTIGRDVFSSIRWQSALEAAGALVHGVCSLSSISESKASCTMRRALAAWVTDLSVGHDGTGYALLKDPTCLCGSEASINQKLLGERTLLEEGSIVVLEQVRIVVTQGSPAVLVSGEDLIRVASAIEFSCHAVSVRDMAMHAYAGCAATAGALGLCATVVTS